MHICLDLGRYASATNSEQTHHPGLPRQTRTTDAPRDASDFDLRQIHAPQISCTIGEQYTNEEILSSIGEERCRVKAVVNRKKNWIGHVLRDDSLLKRMMEGRMVGKRVRGRPRMSMIDDLKEGSYVLMKRRADCREKWRTWIPGTCR